MEVIMANTNPSFKSNKISKTFVAAVIGWGLIAITAFAGAGFYAGYQYRADEQAKTSAAVKDALKAAQPAPVVAEASPKTNPGPSSVCVRTVRGSHANRRICGSYTTTNTDPGPAS
jgi:hypothetical protein